jgi:hypothetical protein
VGGGELANHGDHVGVGSQGAVGSGGEEGHVEERREKVPLIRRFLNFAVRVDGDDWRVQVR